MVTAIGMRTQAFCPSMHGRVDWTVRVEAPHCPSQAHATNARRTAFLDNRKGVRLARQDVTWQHTDSKAALRATCKGDLDLAFQKLADTVLLLANLHDPPPDPGCREAQGLLTAAFWAAHAFEAQPSRLEVFGVLRALDWQGHWHADCA